jgi:hypothetical protein
VVPRSKLYELADPTRKLNDRPPVTPSPSERKLHVPSVYGQKYAQAHATGKRVSDLMRERNVSATALAASIPIQRSTLENYCAGRAIPSDLLARFAQKLQTTVAYLTSVTDDPRPAA